MRRAFAVLVCVPSVIAVVLTGFLAGEEFELALKSCVGAVFVLIGLFIGVRTSGNRVGWLMLAYGLLVQISSFLEAYVVAGLPESGWMAWASIWLWYPQVTLLAALLPLYFPDGQLPGKRWRWVLFAVLIGWIGFGFGNNFTAEALEDFSMANPAYVDLPEAVEATLQLTGFLGLVSSVAAGVTAAVVRFRRSSGQERLQMKWFASAAVFLVLTFVSSAVAYETGHHELATLLQMPGSLVLAGGVAVAVLKHQLYDIDRLVSRTVTYAIVVGMLAGVVALVSALVSTQFDNPLVVAAVTLGVAAAFNPLRRRVQRWVDRRFNRTRYDAERVMDEFARSLRDEMDENLVLQGWQGVVSKTMHPSSVGVWVRR